MLVGGKEDFQQRLTLVKHREAGDIVIAFQKETEHADLLRRQGDEQLVAAFRHGQTEGASFFHGRKCNAGLSRAQGRFSPGRLPESLLPHPFSGAFPSFRGKPARRLTLQALAPIDWF